MWYSCYSSDSWKKLKFSLFISSFKENMKINCGAIQKGLPYFTLRNFSPNPFSLMSFTKKWQPMEGKRRKFLCKWLLKHVTLHQKKKGGQNLKFLSQLVLSLSHLDTLVITSHVEKLAKLLLLEAGTIDNADS